MPAGGRSFSLFSVFLIAGLFMGWQPSNHCQTAFSGPSCVSASVILGPQGRSCQGRAGYYSAEIAVRLGAIILGFNQLPQGPSASRVPSLRSGQVRSGRAMPLSARTLDPQWTGPCRSVTLDGVAQTGCPRLWPAPSARPALGRARDPAWAQLGLPAPNQRTCAFCPSV